MSRAITIERFIANPFVLVDKISNKKLTEFIMLFADNYYNNTNPSIDISDEVFDKLVDILKQRDPKSKYFTTIGAPIVNNKVELPFPMFSLNKVKPETIRTWLENHKGSYSLSDKLDGMSAMLYNGHLYKRGQGLDGQDIGYLLNHINIGNVNLKSDRLKDVAIRGELIISKKNFEIINKDGIFKNARNAISGIVNCKNPDKKLCSYVDFVAYNVVSPIIRQEEQYKFLKDCGFNVVFNMNCNKIGVEGLKDLTNMRKKDGIYEIDGIVIIDNEKNYEIRKNNLEDTKRNPSWSVAFKFLNEDNVVECVVEYVEWNISRYNYLKPRVKITPVNLMGSVINYATAHNAKFVFDNKIGKGSIIKITKSGEVIPKIIEVVKQTNADMPDKKYHWNKSNVDIIIDEENEDVNVQQMLFELKANKIKFFNEKAAEKLVKEGFKGIVDIVGNDEKIKMIFGDVMGAKMMKSLKENMEKSSIEDIMAGSGRFDRGLGVKKFKLVNDELFISKWNANSLLKIKGIGAENIKLLMDGKDGFIEYYRELKKKCLDNGIKIVEYVERNENEKNDEKQNGKLNGKKIVLTGFRDAELEKIIVDNGGSCMSSVSKNTDIVIVKEMNDKYLSSSKCVKAKELGIKIIDKDMFIKEIN